ncbi:AraC family transcriptional regulator [Neptunomonas japonica]|uniref:AraC family transcriptional regulator n=1 Tax=Neptunomonas japonica JAMM 1380 TaxID=1441457 RepID=A0A7R6SXL5_9GAMM|nr:AraC family transcriptional regulator [Neptunomonas japonica]BBB30782.1 AraC family transcriptional regulator [Neptunomonas japonica JAMM 1380]
MAQVPLSDATKGTTIASIVLMIKQAIESHGCDSQPIFKAAGIDVTQARNPEARFPAIAMQNVWNLAIEETGNEGLGLTVARQLSPIAFNGLGFSWLASDTLFDALQRLSRYFKIINNGTTLELNRYENESCLWLIIPAEAVHVINASIDSALALFIQVCRMTADQEITPLRVEMRRAKPLDITPFDAFFKCPIEYSSKENRIYFDNDTLDQALPTANTVLARVNDLVVIDYLARFDKDNTIAQVRAIIIGSLPSGRVTQQVVAKELNCSLRNLQRKLQHEGCSFKALLEDTRKDLAEQYLKGAPKSHAEITYLLGFSEPSNFTRAFKRWFQCNPQEYRQQRLQS